jgi:hypothetical protein
MRKRFTADIELSERDMKAFLEIVAANALTFTMHDIPNDTPAPIRRHTNGHAKPITQVFPKDLMIHVTNKPLHGLTAQQLVVLGKLRTQYGDKPFRKGEGSSRIMREITGGSSCMTSLCRSGHLAAP